jgi:hydroxymethylpyrimidine/phosphomethylpyrimidine kinase
MVTPNIPEAESIAGMGIKSVDDMIRAAERIAIKGGRYVLLKGGHLGGDPADVLFDGVRAHVFEGKRIDTKNTHGTGCTLSSAIAANLALGCSVTEAVVKARVYLRDAIRHSLQIGMGAGPLNHFHRN